MSRPIKFRAWCETNECWYNPHFIEMNLDGQAMLHGAEGLVEIIPASAIEQYTGLTDKNGKEIYEGDIVYDIYTGDEVFIVGWDKDKASFMLTDTADYPLAYFDEYKPGKDLEVIGNVHENPELIGGDE